MNRARGIRGNASSRSTAPSRGGLGSESALRARDCRIAGDGYAEIRFELAEYLFGLAENAASLECYEAALESPSIFDALQAKCIVALNDVRSRSDVAVDLDQLRRGIDGCLRCELRTDAAIGLTMLGQQLRRAGVPVAGRQHLERAIELYSTTDDVLGGPSILRDLATLAIADGDPASALAHVQRAIAWVDRAPVLSAWPRRVRQKLLDLRDRILAARGT